MDNQTLFDQATAHLVAQRVQSFSNDGETCDLKSDDGTKFCPVGLFLKNLDTSAFAGTTVDYCLKIEDLNFIPRLYFTMHRLQTAFGKGLEVTFHKNLLLAEALCSVGITYDNLPVLSDLQAFHDDLKTHNQYFDDESSKRIMKKIAARHQLAVPVHLNYTSPQPYLNSESVPTRAEDAIEPRFFVHTPKAIRNAAAPADRLYVAVRSSKGPGRRVNFLAFKCRFVIGGIEHPGYGSVISPMSADFLSKVVACEGTSIAEPTADFYKDSFYEEITIQTVKQKALNPFCRYEKFNGPE